MQRTTLTQGNGIVNKIDQLTKAQAQFTVLQPDGEGNATATTITITTISDVATIANLLKDNLQGFEQDIDLLAVCHAFQVNMQDALERMKDAQQVLLDNL